MNGSQVFFLIALFLPTLALSAGFIFRILDDWGLFGPGKVEPISDVEIARTIARNNNYVLNMPAYREGVEIWVPKPDEYTTYEMIKKWNSFYKGFIRV